MSTRTRVLFITWDGPGSTYLKAFFVPLFVALREHGFIFHVVQFTWATSAERRRVQRVCSTAGIKYRSVDVWRTPVSAGSLATALSGRRYVRSAIHDFQIDMLMPRSTLPAIASIPAAGTLPIMLDADGFPNEERIEFRGASRIGPSYRLLRWLETWALRRADAVTVRTSRASHILAARTGIEHERFHVVPNARDEHVFRPMSHDTRAARRAELGIADAPLLVYAGSSLKGKYLGAEVLQFFSYVQRHRPDARLLLLTPHQDEARALLSSYRDLDSACFLRAAEPEQVPEWLASADLGLCLIRPTFSMQAASAIKLGEYLLCGVPVVATAGVGETNTVLNSGVGFCIPEIGSEWLSCSAEWFVNVVLADREGFRCRCRKAGLLHFSNSNGLSRWRDALNAALDLRRREAKFS